MPKKSFVNAAYDVLAKKYDEEKASVPMPFGDLMVAVGHELGYDNEEDLLKIASRFYTDLTLDGRFVIKENNTWVLREHEMFENVHIDMNEVYSLDEYKHEDEVSEAKNELEESDGEEEEIIEKSEDDEKEEELGEEENGDFAGSDSEYDENN